MGPVGTIAFADCGWWQGGPAPGLAGSPADDVIALDGWRWAGRCRRLDREGTWNDLSAVWSLGFLDRSLRIRLLSLLSVSWDLRRVKCGGLYFCRVPWAGSGVDITVRGGEGQCEHRIVDRRATVPVLGDRQPARQ